MLGLFHTLYFEGTRKCNLNCAYCSSGSNKEITEEDLPYDKIIQNILDPAWELGTRYIEFSGGEFLLRPDANELLEYAHKKGFRVGIASNGTTLTPEKINQLKKILGDNLLISLGLNSFDATNKDTRDADASFTEKKIQFLESQNVKMNICVTMAEFNADSFGNTLDNIRSRSLPYNRIPYVPRNSSDKSHMFDKKTLKEKLHPALRKHYHGYVSYIPFFLFEDHYAEISGQCSKTHAVPTNPSVGCWVGSFYAINPTGDVSPCPLLADHVSGGNINDTPLKDILFESDLFRRIVKRDELGGKCGKCRFNWICGGCRALTYYHTGDVFGEDPTCFIDELSEKEIIELEAQIHKNFKNYVRMARFGGIYTKPEKKQNL